MFSIREWKSFPAALHRIHPLFLLMNTRKMPKNKGRKSIGFLLPLTL